MPFLTARENLLWVAGLRKEKGRSARKAAGQRADQLLEELGLSARAGNVPEKLSGGERQRVAIGRALMNDPDLVLVDEPTAALDTAMGRQVVQLLRREIKDRGKTGIMVTHDLRMVEYTDRVFEITDGFLELGGDPVERAAPGTQAPLTARRSGRRGAVGPRDRRVSRPISSRYVAIAWVRPLRGR